MLVALMSKRPPLYSPNINLDALYFTIYKNSGYYVLEGSFANNEDNQQILRHLLSSKLPQPQPPPCSLKCLSIPEWVDLWDIPEYGLWWCMWLQACFLSLQGLFLWGGCSPYCLGPCLALQGLQPSPRERDSPFVPFRDCVVFSAHT